MINLGTFWGLLIAFAQFKLVIGVPAVVLALFVLARRVIPRSDVSHITVYLGLTIVWMLVIQTMVGNRDTLSVFSACLGPVILFLSTFLRVNERVVAKIFRVLFALFLVDFLFNISVILFGVDLVGRGGSLREGDYLQRLGGVVGHPFASVNFTVVACFAAMLFKNHKMFLLAAFGLLINGTFRAPLGLALLLSILIVLRVYPRTWVFVLMFPAVAAAVVYTTFLTAGDGDFMTGNALRMIAWANAIERIGDSPIIGFHGFQTGSFENMSRDTLIDFGIAESPVLQLWLDYGVVAPVFMMITFITIISKSLNKSRENPDNPFYFTGAAMAAYAFIDFGFGTFFGSINTTIPMALLCLSYRSNMTEPFPLSVRA